LRLSGKRSDFTDRFFVTLVIVLYNLYTFQRFLTGHYPLEVYLGIDEEHVKFLRSCFLL
jgi:hypothetical protein